MAFAMAMLERIASLPPLSTQAFPDLRHSTAASAVTLGLASYIIPTTPSGTRTLVMFSPFGRTQPPSFLPIGSSSAHTSRTAAAIAYIRFSLSLSLSTSDSDMPFSRAAATSSAFAASISPQFFSIASAIAATALFFSAVDAEARTYDASLAAFASLVTSVIAHSSRIHFIFTAVHALLCA